MPALDFYQRKKLGGLQPCSNLKSDENSLRLYFTKMCSKKGKSRSRCKNAKAYVDDAKRNMRSWSEVGSLIGHCDRIQVLNRIH